jgi:hypothetical protein
MVVTAPLLKGVVISKHQILLLSNSCRRKLQQVIGCGLPVLCSQTPCKTPQEKKRESKESISLRVFAKTKTHLHK